MQCPNEPTLIGSLLDNGILQIDPECQLIDSLTLGKSKFFNNFDSNIITPLFKISLESIAPYLSQVANKNPLQLEKFITKRKFHGNMPLSHFEFKISILDKINENLGKIIKTKENCYYEYILKLIIGLIVTLLLTFLIVIIITVKLYRYYLIIKNITLENTHLQLDSLNEETTENLRKSNSIQTVIFTPNSNDQIEQL